MDLRIIFVSYADVDLRGYILAGNIYIYIWKSDNKGGKISNIYWENNVI